MITPFLHRTKIPAQLTIGSKHLKSPQSMLDLTGSVDLGGGDLGDIEELGRVFGGGESVAKHAVAKRAGGADGRGSGGDEFFGAGLVHALAGFFAEEDQAAAGPATERSLARAGRVDDLRGAGDDLARLVVDAAITA